jgi:predicted secreted protein
MALSAPAGFASAQLPAQQLATAGTLVIVPAFGEVTRVNDQVQATFMIEEQNKDKAVAASLVNKKMKQGTNIIRQADHQAILKTRGYYTYPVYAEESTRAPTNKTPLQTGWRVGQYLEVTTTDLDGLAKTVAAAQGVLALNGLQFGLADATRKKLDQQRLEATYQNLLDRVAAIAKAMGRNVSDAVIETIDFEGSGAYEPSVPASKVMRMSAQTAAPPVEEPSFEPGETRLDMRAVGKVKFK